ncbi:MAG: ATP-binding protein [Deltaproteobacteria bacterium]|nr:ATP-binding protein [Deltaproteobacteria bacterium]
MARGRIRSYSNSPSPKLLEKIGATNLTLADAIAEIVANSFDAAVADEPIDVSIEVGPDEVSVIDNGVGMVESTLIEAVRLGVDMSQVVKKKIGAKGHFGLGMKTACASIGRWWAVYTRPMGESVEYRVVFDLAEWEDKPDSAEAWTIQIEEIEDPDDGPLCDRRNGTAIVVRKLRQKDPMSGAVLAKLGEAFKPHLGQGDSIRVNGDPATPHTYSFVPGSQVPISIVFGPKDEYKITGWVAIDSQTHNEGDYGFNIYRHGQLVQAWCQDWFASHLMTSRIIGDVNMDFIDATFFKQGLQQSDLWRLASAEMREFLKPIVKASRELSRKGNIHKSKMAGSIVTTMRASVGVVPAGDLHGAGTVEESGVVEPLDEECAELPKLTVDPEFLQLADGSRISVSLVEKSLSSNGTPYDFLFAAQGSSLQTVLNTNHPLFEGTKDKDLLCLVAKSDSILRYLVEERGESGRKAAEIRNEWILAALGVVSKGVEG